MDQAVTAAGLSPRVRFVELTVDPVGIRPLGLAAYRNLVGAPANWSLLTGSPDTINSIWRYFGVWYQAAEGSPPGPGLADRSAIDLRHQPRRRRYLPGRRRPGAIPRGGRAQRQRVPDRPGVAPVLEQRGAPIWPIPMPAPGRPRRV